MPVNQITTRNNIRFQTQKQEVNVSLSEKLDFSDDLHPHVQYAGRGGRDRHELLRPIRSRVEYDRRSGDHERINCVGPLYLLTSAERDRLIESARNGYASLGNSTVAQELIEKSRSDGRAIYPLFLESDSPKPENGGYSLFEVRDVLKDAVEELFDLSPEECQFYVSGSGSGDGQTMDSELSGGSMHVHTGLYVRDSGDLDQVRSQIESKNLALDGIEIDPNVATKNRQFRIPFTRHRKGGVKTPISHEGEPVCTKKDIVDAFSKDPPPTAEDYYQDLLCEEWTVSNNNSISSSPLTDAVNNTEGNLPEKGAETPESSSVKRTRRRGFDLNPLLKELGQSIAEIVLEPEEPDELTELWYMYNRTPFNPSGRAHRSDATHSIVIFDTALSSFEKHDKTLVPAFIRGAVGFDGEIDCFNESRPVKLSKWDAERYTKNEDGATVLLGAKNGRSKIFDVSDAMAYKLTETLREDGRQATLERLRSEGYDVSKRDTGDYKRAEPEPEQTDALEMKRKLDSGQLDVTEPRVFQVCCRLLKNRGYQKTMQWLSDLYGEDFRLQYSHDKLAEIVEQYPDSYDHVRVPDTAKNQSKQQ